MNIGKKLAICLLIMTTIVFSGCANTESAQTDESMKLGGLFSLTGFAAFAGEAANNGFILALEDADTDIEYVLEDFASDFGSVVSAATKLVTLDEVDVVIGPEWNEFSEIVEPIATENNVLFISPWMTSEAEYAKSPYYFTATPSERTQMEKLIQYAAEKDEIKTMALVFSNNAWSTAYAGIFKEELKKNGQITLLEEHLISHESPDFRTVLTKIKESEPDAIMTVISSGGGMGLLTKQKTEIGLDVKHYSPFSNAENDDFIETYPELAKDIIYPAPKKHTRADEFASKYEKRFDAPPTAISAATAYDMTTLVLAAIEAGAKTTDDVREYLLHVKNYNGYSNTITFNEYGQVASEEVVIKKLDGRNSTIVEE